VDPDALWVRYGKDIAVRVRRFSQLSRAWEAVPALADRGISVEIVSIPRIPLPPTVDFSETSEESAGEPALGSSFLPIERTLPN